MLKFHPSSVGLIMTDAKSIDPTLLTGDLAAIAKKKTKTDDDKAILQPLHDQTLSVGAKTFLKSLAKEYLFGYHAVVTTKYMEKGLLVEDESIDLYNSVFFTNHKKNTERRENKVLTGECDIFTGRRLIDMKSAWSLDTFPAFSEDAHDPLYEWQGRSYMQLWDCDEFELAYCLVNTPEELIRYEQRDLHIVDHIPPEMRVTSIIYKRDMELEKKLVTKCEVAQKYLEELVSRFNEEKKHDRIHLKAA
jgi:hypothetical protein